jgi:hypothetical protein
MKTYTSNNVTYEVLRVTYTRPAVFGSNVRSVKNPTNGLIMYVYLGNIVIK